MSEKRFKVDTYCVRKYCEQCGNEMEPTGEVIATNPAWYVHKCIKCGAVETYKVSYPIIISEETQEEI